MRIGLQLLLAATLSCSWIPSTMGAEDKPAFKDDREKASYAAGMYFGGLLKRANMDDLDTAIILGTMKDVLAGRTNKLTDAEAQAALGSYQQKRMHDAFENNAKEGEAFLAKNKTQPGVKTHSVTLPDGTVAELQYKVITAGEGEIPAATNMVSVNYRGTLINGTEFDSTAKHGNQPMKFMVSGVIRGWSEALQLMPVGSKWQLFIPASLGYRDRPSGAIPPGSTLIFDVELLGIESPEPPPTSSISAQPLTSDIVRVPSAEDMKKGSNIQVLKPEDVARMMATQTNQAKGKTNTK